MEEGPRRAVVGAVLLLLLAAAPHASAQSPDLVLSVTADVRLAVPVEALSENLSLAANSTGRVYPERVDPDPSAAGQAVNTSNPTSPTLAPVVRNSTSAAPSGAVCGAQHVRALPDARGFAFNESESETGCAEVLLAFTPPSGVTSIVLSFQADRNVTRAGGVTRSSPAANFVQELRLKNASGAIVTRETVIPTVANSVAPTRFEILLTLPNETAAFNVSWYFEDSGADATQGLVTGPAVSPNTGLSYRANVTGIEIRVVGATVNYGRVMATNETQEGDAIRNRTVIAVATPTHDGYDATVNLTIRSSLAANLTHVVSPSGAIVPITLERIVLTSNERILTLDAAFIAKHGEGTYGLAFETVRPVPVVPPTPPLTIFPLAFALVVFPVIPGALATRATWSYHKAATGRFAPAARALVVTFAAAVLVYVAALAYAFYAGRIDAMARLPLSPEGGLLAGLFLLIAVAFLALWIVPGRYAMRALEADVEERRRAEAKFRGLLDATPDAILILNPSGTVVLVNKQAERLFAKARDDLVGKPVDVVLPRFGDARADSGGSAVELVALRSDGEEFPIEMSVSPIETEEGALLAAAIRDITLRKRTEAELKRSNQELEHFAYVASHDLQEPLRTISGFAQLLEQRYGDAVDDRGKRYIERTVSGTQRMQALINDLLAYSRVQTQGKPFVDVDLEATVDAVLLDLEAVLRAAGATVTRGALPRVRGDSSQLAQAISNLVRNAVKYRHPDRAPVVAISAAREARAWRVSVRDNGVGIEPQYHERVFVIFQRLQVRDDDGGTGLGLAITKRIIERHHGRIWIESTPGDGATFHFTIPDSGETSP